ncbi:MAG: cytochrome P450 [Tepidiformaceae bacterium]
MNPQPAAQPSPFAEMLATDPFPLYANFRQIAPVTKIEAIGLWLILKYDDVVRALRDPETFSSVVGAKEIAGEALPPTMLFNDPPVHTRMRSLVQKAFTPRVVELQRAAIQERADALIAAMLEHEVVDVVEELAYPLPITVIAKMLGVEDGDMPTFKRWSDDILDNIIPIVMTGDDTGLASTNVEFDAYFHEQIERYRRHPEENLLSGLIHVETDEGHLSEEELLMFCRLLLVAGNETTTGLIVNAIRAFAEFPDALTRLRGDMSLLPSAMEETLRFYAPFQAVFRRVTRDVELRGVTIPAGDRCLVMLASANRDEEVFERASEFEIDRDPNRHVSFGMGIHYCLGAPLARLEADIALRTLIPRITRVEREGSVPGDLFRPGGPKSYTVRLTRG